MLTLSLLHRTVYRYSKPVQLLPHRLQLRPREGQELKLLRHEIACVPHAAISWSKDVFGNEIAVASFAVTTDRLTIESTATVELYASSWPVFDIDVSAIAYPFNYAEGDWIDLGALTVPQYEDEKGKLPQWARSFIASSSTDTLSLLKDLNLGVNRQIAYQSREDAGTQSPVHTLLRGWGSCRDLSILLVESARVLGFGARIVSGYLLPLEPRTVGTGATHAWAEIFVPGPGWIAFDPTNGTMGGAGLIPTTVARGIFQAVPASGSFVGPSDAFKSMEVEVIVREAFDSWSGER
ncbi:Transglutaminase-like enzyme, putative cysteine protease [Devosia crocina]|uniref:Transglutaminase-like enzyme, putative cysteine protease n=1 Tax=Devosia crocina TaxID=429728 RepID=A0A1I7NVJ8_9HYPH|nr:transglutaminase family protein [Devosia crocina]SFV38618.1 Transglutaminase-like enzyme, putative cysteine protease [Devosia crocina]